MSHFGSLAGMPLAHQTEHGGSLLVYRKRVALIRVHFNLDTIWSLLQMLCDGVGTSVGATVRVVVDVLL